MNKIKNLSYNKIIYKIYYCDICGLINFFKLNEKIIDNFETLMKIHRPKDINFTYTKIINEDIYSHFDYNIQTFYQIIYNPINYDIVTIARINVDNKEKKCGLSMIHTNIKYRNQQFCQKNINLLLKNTKNFKYKYILYVDKDNIPAIKCYKKCNFIITKLLDDKNLYLMENKN